MASVNASSSAGSGSGGASAAAAQASGSSSSAANDRKAKDRLSKSFSAKQLSTSAKRIQKELAEITLDPPPNCRFDSPTDPDPSNRIESYHKLA